MIEVLEEKISPEVGEPGKQVELFLRIKFQSQVVREEVIKNLVEPILAGNTPPGFIPLQNPKLYSHRFQSSELGKPANPPYSSWLINQIRACQCVKNNYQIASQQGTSDITFTMVAHLPFYRWINLIQQSRMRY
jgi:hypothetical protein